MADEARVPIDRDVDIVTARQLGRELAAKAGFSGADLTLIATAISEVARNIVVYAERGEIRLGLASKNGRPAAFSCRGRRPPRPSTTSQFSFRRRVAAPERRSSTRRRPRPACP